MTRSELADLVEKYCHEPMPASGLLDLMDDHGDRIAEELRLYDRKVPGLEVALRLVTEARDLNHTRAEKAEARVAELEAWVPEKKGGVG
jgi:hypothetical protein